MLRLYWNGWEEVLLFQAKPRFKINVYFVGVDYMFVVLSD